MMSERGHVHFIGIGGTGLSAIARILHERGYIVSGSDRAHSALVQELLDLGIAVTIGHRAENIRGANLVIRSSAIPDTNIEVAAAKQQGIPVWKRFDFLNELTANLKTIAIAGTHGKTTTTAMCAWVLTRMGYDPTYIIGGTSVDLKTNAHAGKGEYFVIEADEYDGMFLGLNPYAAIITNVEHDHPDCYPTQASFEEGFVRFANKVDGVLIGCFEDQGVRNVFLQTNSPATKIQYGLAGKLNDYPLDYKAKISAINENGAFNFSAFYGDDLIAQVKLNVPGKHNVQNALAVIALSHWMDMPLDGVAQALSEFHGTGRRFEERGRIGDMVLIDDYAHHPSEIRATIAAAKTRFPKQFIWVVWQPHTYSRTMTFWDQFREAFADADGLIVLDVFAARENTPPGFSMEKLVAEISHPNRYYFSSIKEAYLFLSGHLKGNEIVLVLSAGDANYLNEMLFESLIARSNAES
ncbi:MAG: UDP-N-acetylmuramate--L-alanine ligase [Anaerolineales bacterium]